MSLKQSHYSPDGKGRDLWMVDTTLYNKRIPIQNEWSKEWSPPKPKLSGKCIKYLPDGSGRDSYITLKGQCLRKFPDTLRDYATRSREFSHIHISWLNRRKKGLWERQNQLISKLNVPRSVKDKKTTVGLDAKRNFQSNILRPFMY